MVDDFNTIFCLEIWPQLRKKKIIVSGIDIEEPWSPMGKMENHPDSVGLLIGFLVTI